MRTNKVFSTLTHRMLITSCTVLAVILTALSSSNVSAQNSGTWAIKPAQQAVRRQIVTERAQQQGQDPTEQRRNNGNVQFNNDVRTEARSNSSVLVRGTGSTSVNNGYYNNNNNNNYDRRRAFSYEAMVNRNRNGNNSNDVSNVRYDWRDGRDNSGRRNSDNPNWSGYGYGNGSRPDGRVSYSGPIMNRHSEKGLDVAGGSTQDGANVQQWGYSNQAHQNWDLIDLGNGEIAILSRHSGMALTVQGGRDSNGANIIQRAWNDSRQQRWRFEEVNNGYFKIVSVDNGKCLDVAAQGRQDGANIQIWDYANQENQQWRLKR